MQEVSVRFLSLLEQVEGGGLRGDAYFPRKQSYASCPTCNSQRKIRGPNSYGEIRAMQVIASVNSDAAVLYSFG